MNWLYLALIQGIGEFIPISSSSHLYLYALYNNLSHNPLSLEIALHAGTLLAICCFFWRDLWGMTKDLFISLFKLKMTPGLVLFLTLCLATIPAIFFGFIVKRYLKFDQTLFTIGLSSLVFGSLLAVADKIGKENHPKLKIFQAFLIGVFQCLAFIPGASRLGSCLIAGRFLGIKRWPLTHFSFLLSIPTVLGACILETYDLYKQQALFELYHLWPCIIATFIIGLCALLFLKKYLHYFSFIPFAFYRIVLGIFLIYLSFL